MDRIVQIQQMLKAEPDDVFLNYALAMEYMSQDNPSDAISVLERVKTLDPGYLPLYYQLAGLYAETDEEIKAIETYEAGILIARQQSDTKTERELKSALEELTF